LWKKFEDKKGILTKLDENGDNLSQGEKQLVCLARAMINKTKLILLDEATANVDVVTEKKIQDIIKEKFEGCTILMIAHRLNTIMFADDVLVLNEGKVLEYGEVSKLKNDEKSFFGKLLKRDKEIKEMLK